MTHKVSEQTTQAAQKHAVDSLKHGQAIEELTEKLKTGDPTEQEQARRVEPYGKTIKEHAEEFLAKVQNLKEDDYSTEAFAECVQEHIEINKAHIQAVKEFQNAAYLHSAEKKHFD